MLHVAIGRIVLIMVFFRLFRDTLHVFRRRSVSFMPPSIYFTILPLILEWPFFLSDASLLMRCIVWRNGRNTLYSLERLYLMEKTAIRAIFRWWETVTSVSLHNVLETIKSRGVFRVFYHNPRLHRGMNASGKGLVAFWLHRKGEQWSVKSVDKQSSPQVSGLRNQCEKLFDDESLFLN